MAGAVVRVAIVGDNSSLSRALRDSQSKLSSFGSKAAKFGAIFGVAAGVGLGALAKNAIDVEAQFSRTMNTLAAATGAPAADIEKLNDLAIKLGTSTSFSANEAAAAMLELSKAGLSTRAIMSGAADGTLLLAEASGTDLAQAATIGANAMAVFGLKGKDMGAIAAALAGGANASTASVESLGQALAQVGPGAANAGLSLNETVGVLAAFDSAGIKGSDAGTSLKTMLARLVPSTKSAASAMKDLGLDFTDSKGNIDDITTVAEKLQNRLGPLSQEQRQAALTTIFGSDATRAATVLMNQGSEGLAKYIRATQDKNAAEEMAQARMKGTAGALERISGMVETVQLQLGKVLAPAVIAFADGLEVAIPVVTSFASTMKSKLAPVFGVIGDAVAAGVSAIADFDFSKLSPLVDAVKNLGSSLVSAAQTIAPALATIWGALQPILKIAAGAVFLGLVTAFNLLGPAVQGVATAFAASVQWISENGTAVAILAGVITAVMLPALVVWGVQSAVSGALAAAAWLGAQVASITSTAIQIANLYRTAAAWTMAGARAIVAAARIAAAWLIALGPIGLIIAGVIAVVAVIVLLWKKSDAFKAGVLRVWSAIKSGTATAFNAIKSVISTVWNAIKSVFTSALNSIKSVVSSVWNAIVAVIRTAVNVVKGIIGGVRVVVEIIRSAFEAARSAVSTKISAVVTLVKSLPGKIKGALSGAATWLLQAGKDVISGLINGIQSMASSLVSAIQNSIIDKIPGPVKKALGIGSPSRVFRAIGIDTMQGLIIGLQQGSAGIERTLDRVTASMTRYMKTALKLKPAVIKARMKGLSDEAAALRANGKAQDAVTAKLVKHREALADLVKEAADYAAGIKTAVIATGDLTQLGQIEGGGVSVTAMIDQLKNRVANAQRFAALMRQLAATNLNQTTITQLVSAGVEGGLATAEALAAGGQSAITEVNTLTTQLQAAGADLGSSMKSEFFDAGIAAQEGLIKGLESDAAALDRAAASLAGKLVAAVKRALGIRSPSKVFEELGDQTARGLAIGVDSTYVTRAGTGMAKTLVSAFGKPQLKASAISGNGRAQVTVKLTSEQVSQLERGRSIQLDLDAYRSAGGRSRA